MPTTFGISIPLGVSQYFAVQAGASVSFNGPQTTITTGSVGVAPGTSITGNSKIDNGAIELDSVRAIQCSADVMTAYKAAAAATCTVSLSSPEIAGTTLMPGVYCSTYITITGGFVTLDGNNNPKSMWVFQTAKSVITSYATSFILINGALAQNVYWQVGSSATLGVSSNFVGTILTYASISFDTDAVLIGRALAQVSVSFAGGSVVTLPTSSGSLQFTPSPSMQPTYPPTASPTLQPTYPPPTMPPTASPTAELPKIVIRAKQVVGGITSADASSDQFKTAFIIAAAASLNLTSSAINVESVTSITTARQLLNTGASVVYTISVRNSVEAITSLLTSAISATKFDTSMHSQGYTQASATTGIIISDVPPTPSPTSAPNIIYARSFQIGVSIGVIVLFFILVFATFCCCVRKTAAGTSQYCCCCV